MDDQSDHDAVTAGNGDSQREWYIEARGASVGPLEGPALERMWRDGTIDGDTLVWAAGFNGWLPLGDVPELSYLRLGPRDAGSAGARDGKWRPQSAPGVGTLFRGETEHAPGGSKPAAAPPPPLPGLPVISPRPPEPSRWRIELSGLRRTTITGLNHAWRALQDAQVRHRRMAVLAVVMSAFAIVTTGGLAYVLTRRPAVEPLAAVAVAGSPATTAAPSASGAQDTSTVVPAADTPAATPPAPDTSAAAVPHDAASGADAEAKATSVAAGAPVSTRESEEDEGDEASLREADDQGADDDYDETEEEDAADEEDAPEERDGSSALVAAAPLTKSEIIDATRGQVTTLAECIKQARRIGELQPRHYDFVLDWVIRADGGVSAPALKGPPELLASGLRTCFEAKMAGWRYRPSAQDSPVANFPLGVNVP